MVMPYHVKLDIKLMNSSTRSYIRWLSTCDAGFCSYMVHCWQPHLASAGKQPCALASSRVAGPCCSISVAICAFAAAIWRVAASKVASSSGGAVAASTGSCCMLSEASPECVRNDADMAAGTDGALALRCGFVVPLPGTATSRCASLRLRIWACMAAVRKICDKFMCCCILAYIAYKESWGLGTSIGATCIRGGSGACVRTRK